MLDPVSAGAASGVIATAMSGGIKQAVLAIKSYYNNLDQNKLLSRGEVSKVARIVDKVVAGDLDTPVNALPYLQSPEFVSFLEHLFVFKLAGRGVESSGPLFVELRNGAELYQVDDIRFVESIFSISVSLVDNLLAQADVDLRSEALDSSSETTAHYVVSTSILSSIESQMRVLTKARTLSLDDHNLELDKYMEAVAAVLGRIQPPNFDESKNVPLDALYVTPTLIPVADSDGGRGENVELDELLNEFRMVILGDPGGGKTTLTRRIASSLCNGTQKLVRGSLPLVPFVVVLRDYGPDLTTQSLTIPEYIAKSAKTTFQSPLLVETVEWTLSTGRAYVIFDGLDELLKTDSRRKIADAITAFCTRYRNVRVLVTSRRVGYAQAPLPEEIFGIVKLGDLDDENVEIYVDKWFNLDATLSADEASRLKSTFMAESETVEDLRSNPLMLALMCTIYRAEGYIPRNRPDMYEKCSRMLFDRWDRHRGLLESFEFEAHVEPALMYIAHSIFCDEAHQSGVTESYLIDLAADYLQKWWIDDQARAVHAARAFIEFCRGRAWVFTDVGLDETEETLFQFTHRTFLEYFAAAHITRISDSTEKLCQTLSARVEKGEWDVVCQLAFQIRAKAIQGAGDVIIRYLIKKAESNGVIEQGNILQFVVRCLSFVIITPATVKELSEGIVRRSIHLAMNGAGMTSRDICRGIAKAAAETRASLVVAVGSELREALVRGNARSIDSALSISWTFVHTSLTKELSDLVRPLSEKIREISRQNLQVAWSTAWLYRQGEIPVSEVVDHVGKRLFAHSYEVTEMRIYTQSLVSEAISHAIKARCTDPDRCADLFSLLAPLRDVLLRSIPLSNQVSTGGFTIRDLLDASTFKRHRTLTEEELVSVTVLVAWYLETSENPKAGLARLLRSRLKATGSLLGNRILKKSAVYPNYSEVYGWNELVKWSEDRLDFGE